MELITVIEEFDNPEIVQQKYQNLVSQISTKVPLETVFHHKGERLMYIDSMLGQIHENYANPEKLSDIFLYNKPAGQYLIIFDDLKAPRTCHLFKYLGV